MFPGYIESEDSWREFLRSLVARGLTGVRLVVSDNHVGIKKAVETVFPEAKTQRCMVHFMRNVLLRVPPRLRKEVGAALKAIFAQESAEEARVKAGESGRKVHEAAACVNEDPDAGAGRNPHVLQFSCRTLEENTDDELYGEANQGDPQEDQGCRGFFR